MSVLTEDSCVPSQPFIRATRLIHMRVLRLTHPQRLCKCPMTHPYAWMSVCACVREYQCLCQRACGHMCMREWEGGREGTSGWVGVSVVQKRRHYTKRDVYIQFSECAQEHIKCESLMRLETNYRKRYAFTHKETYTYNSVSSCKSRSNESHSDQMRGIHATWDELIRKKTYLYGTRRNHTKRDVSIRLCEWEEGREGRTECAGAHTGQKRNLSATCTQKKDIFLRLSEWVQENIKWDVFVRKFVRDETPVHMKRHIWCSHMYIYIYIHQTCDIWEHQIWEHRDACTREETYSHHSVSQCKCRSKTTYFERWGAGVEYHFQEFNEPYAPS